MLAVQALGSWQGAGGMVEGLEVGKSGCVGEGLEANQGLLNEGELGTEFLLSGKGATVTLWAPH